ncbi:MAG: PAS domain S-box protein [Chloroflexi bacterium]|nr:PAS domain S-box protein [Chloroflexota bacterium]
MTNQKLTQCEFSSDPLRILLVEDSEHDVMAFRRAFKKSQIFSEITHYVRAEKALERLGTDPASFDLVVTDHKLPGMTGLELCLELLERETPLPLVILTGTGSEHLVIKALKTGVSDYLVKDPDYGYLDLLPVVLPGVVQQYEDRLARQQAEEGQHKALAAREKALVRVLEATHALRESEEQFRKLFEQSNDAIIIHTMDAQIQDVNSRMVEMIGYEKDVLLVMTVTDLLCEDVRPHLQDAFLTVEEEKWFQTESKFVKADATMIDVDIRASLVDPEKGIIQAIVRDITERKRAEIQLLRLQNLLQNITDSMPSALITLDLAGRVLTWNPTAQALTGRTADQIQGQSLWQTCPELVRYRDLVEDVIRTNQIVHKHKEPVTGDAGTIYRDVSVFPLETHDIEGVVLRIDDVTQRVQLEEGMLQSAKMASIGGLAAGVAHEINNPLAAMMNSAQILQMAFDTQRSRTRERLQACGVNPQDLDRYLQERELREYLDGIRTVGERAAKIVSDLLSFSRRTSSRAAYHNLNTLVRQTLDLAATDYDLGKKYDFRNVEIIRELAPDLPKLLCDRQQIQQVILNLVRNAMQAIVTEIEKDDSGYNPQLTVRTLLVPDPAPFSSGPMFVRLEIEDNGPGVPKAMQEQLFTPFSTNKDMDEGTGLGLWLCWSIVVERHKGRIRAEVGRNGGARLVVELPCV